jgi:hypothetical protein
MLRKAKMRKAVFLLGVLPFFISFFSWAKPRLELPAAAILADIVRSEKLQPQRHDVDALRYKPFDWEPSILPKSIRSWMMLELDDETIRAIQKSPDL